MTNDETMNLSFVVDCATPFAGSNDIATPEKGQSTAHTPKCITKRDEAAAKRLSFERREEKKVKRTTSTEQKKLNIISFFPRSPVRSEFIVRARHRGSIGERQGNREIDFAPDTATAATAVATKTAHTHRA